MNPGRMKAQYVFAASWLLVANARAQTTAAIENVTVIDVVAGLARPGMTVVVAVLPRRSCQCSSHMELPEFASWVRPAFLRFAGGESRR